MKVNCRNRKQIYNRIKKSSVKIDTITRKSLVITDLILFYSTVPRYLKNIPVIYITKYNPNYCEMHFNNTLPMRNKKLNKVH